MYRLRLPTLAELLYITWMVTTTSQGRDTHIYLPIRRKRQITSLHPPLPPYTPPSHPAATPPSLPPPFADRRRPPVSQWGKEPREGGSLGSSLAVWPPWLPLLPTMHRSRGTDGQRFSFTALGDWEALGGTRAEPSRAGFRWLAAH